MIRPRRPIWTRPLTFMLVVVFKVLSRLRPLLAKTEHQPAPESILIFSTAGIGDTLSDTPAIRAVRESFPNAKIAVVAHAKRQAILAGNSQIDVVIGHRKNPFMFFSTLRRIRGLQPDIAVVLRANDPDIWPLAYLSGASVVVSRPESTVFPFLVNRPVSISSWDSLPGVLQTLEIVKAIGASTPDPRIVYSVREDEHRDMEVRLTEFRDSYSKPASKGIPAGNIVAVQIHHSPRLAFRDWPENSFVILCRKILEEFPVRIILTGGQADSQKAKKIYSELNRLGLGNKIINWVGRLSLRQSGALLEQSAFFITTDTGIMHMGFAVNVPTIALLHPYNARRVGPHGYGNRHRTLVMKGPETDDRGRLRSIADISPDDVTVLFREMYSDTVS